MSDFWEAEISWNEAEYFYKKCQGMAASDFLSFLHVLTLKIRKQNMLLFFDDGIS